MSNAEASLYAVIVAADGHVCGVGVSPAAAQRDAVLNVGELDVEFIYDVRPCTAAFEALFRESGGDISYDNQNGVLMPLDHSA